MIVNGRFVMFACAVVCFLLATFNKPQPCKVNLTDLGLAFLTVALWGII